jgi:hypothetical protein
MVGAGVEAAERVATPVRLVEVLDGLEPEAPLLFHDGGLWSGSTYGDEGKAYRLRRFDANGELHSEVTLPHSVARIVPLGPNQVMVVGRSYPGEWRTHYSEVTLRGGALRASSYRFARQWMVQEFAGDGTRRFFTEPGERAILQMGTFGPSKLPVEVSGPGKMVLAGDSLLVLERRAAQLGDENLVRIDLRTNRATRVFHPWLRQGLVNLVALPGGGRVVAAELLADQLLFVDAGLGKLVATVPVPSGRPQGLALRGRCVVVGSADPARRIVTFVDARTPTPTVVAEWELTGAPVSFKSIHALAVDPRSKRVFARSHEACLGCGVSLNSIVVAEPPTDDPAAACDR